MKNYLLFLTVLILFCLIGCNSNKVNEEKQQIVNESISMPEFESPADSLEWVLQTGDDEQRIIALAELRKQRVRPEEVFKYAQQFYSEYKNKNNVIWMGEIALSLGTYHYNITGKMDSCLYYISEAKSFFEKSDDEYRLANCRRNLALVQQGLFDYANAIDNLMMALGYYENTHNKEYIMSTYNTIALTYGTMGNRNKQEEYLLKALDFSKKEEVDEADMGITLINLAMFEINKETRESEQAVEYGKQAVEMMRKAGIPYERNLGILIHRLLEIMNMSGIYDHFEDYYNEAFAIAEKFKNQPLKANLIVALSNYFLSTKNYRDAYNYAKKAENMSDTTDLEYMNYIYHHLTRCAIGIRDIDDGFKYLQLYLSSRNKKMNSALAEKSSELEIKFETEKKQLEIEKQQQIIRRQTLQRNLLIGGVSMSIVILVLLWLLLHLRTKRNHTLAEMNATKDKFFTIISHDLKNPAVAQQQAMLMLLENAKLWDADKLEHYCQGLMKSADGLVDLLYNLLNWAQLQTGRMPFKPVLFDLAADLRETTSTLLNSMAEHKNIKLITELPDTALVTADINMIKTVVRNLVDNAIKFTPTGGNVTLTISPHPSSLTPQTPNPKPQTSSLTPQTPYRISVTDTGVGMNETQIRNLFNRDVTRHASTKGTANESGTGLGLMVCKELLEKHGSMLHVESEEGKGSAFWFELSCR